MWCFESKCLVQRIKHSWKNEHKIQDKWSWCHTEWLSEDKAICLENDSLRTWVSTWKRALWEQVCSWRMAVWGHESAWRMAVWGRDSVCFENGSLMMESHIYHAYIKPKTSLNTPVPSFIKLVGTYIGKYRIALLSKVKLPAKMSCAVY